MRSASRRAPVAAPVALLVALLVALVVGACTRPTVSVAPASVAPRAPVSPVVGVVIHIDSAGLADVSGFRLRVAGGVELAFKIGTLENGAQFPPGHLAEHVATSEPVRIYFRQVGGDLVVYRIEDAGPSPT